MTAALARSLPLSIAVLLALAGCGTLRATPGGSAPLRPAGAPAARMVAPLSIEGPLTACAVLQATHGLAQQADPHAAFTMLLGSGIAGDGLPTEEGEWQAHYQGTEPVNAGGRKPMVQPLYRHIAITVDRAGRLRLEVVEQPGMPLGQAFFDRPMPQIDSRAAIAHARTMRPAQPLDGEFQLTLTGMMNATHFQELVWKVQVPHAAGFSTPVVFNASTGLPLKR